MLILLDIDGVMVPANSWKKPEFLDDGFQMFSTNAIIALQKIISETNATIVLTTSHKSKYNLNEWKNIFKKRNIKTKKIERLPENLDYLNRKEEIIRWYDSRTNIFEEFIIIDDEKSLNGLPKFLKNKLIQTNASLGLTNELADYALRILKEEKEILT
jgi:HAD domain in Swiss Army Knife RNA repair proteins